MTYYDEPWRCKRCNYLQSYQHDDPEYCTACLYTRYPNRDTSWRFYWRIPYSVRRRAK